MSLFLVIPMLLLSAMASPSTEGEYRKKESQLNELRQRIANLNAALNTAKEQQGDLDAELRKRENAIGLLAGELHRLEQTLQQKRNRLSELIGQRQRHEAQLDSQRMELAEQIRAAYVMGRQQRLKILLNQQDPAAVSRLLVYYDYLNRARVGQMTGIQVKLERVREIETEILHEQARLAELQSQRVEEKSRLEAAQALREQTMALLNSEIHGKREQIHGLKQDEKRLATLVQELHLALEDFRVDTVDSQPFSDMKGNLPWPSNGHLVAGFSSGRKAVDLRQGGVLISAPEGKEVRAVHHGRVAFANWFRGFGLLLILDHGDGYMTLYGHNQTLFKETGEWVAAGETLALVGRSGGQNRAGMYFGIRYKGRPVSPRVWCKGIKGDRVG